MATGAARFSALARACRGLLVGALILVLTLAGHAAIGGGALPDAPTALVLFLLATLPSIAIADRRREAEWIFIHVASLEILLHVVLTVMMEHPGQHGFVVMSPWMLVGHVAATLAITVTLCHGEQVLHAWMRMLRVLIGVDPIVDPATPHPSVVSPRPAILRGRVVASPALRRGPPASAFC
jgi:hypothetical protein